MKLKKFLEPFWRYDYVVVHFDDVEMPAVQVEELLEKPETCKCEIQSVTTGFDCIDVWLELP